MKSFRVYFFLSIFIISKPSINAMQKALVPVGPGEPRTLVAARTFDVSDISSELDPQSKNQAGMTNFALRDPHRSDTADDDVFGDHADSRSFMPTEGAAAPASPRTQRKLHRKQTIATFEASISTRRMSVLPVIEIQNFAPDLSAKKPTSPVRRLSILKQPTIKSSPSKTESSSTNPSDDPASRLSDDPVKSPTPDQVSDESITQADDQRAPALFHPTGAFGSRTPSANKLSPTQDASLLELVSPSAQRNLHELGSSESNIHLAQAVQPKSDVAKPTQTNFLMKACTMITAVNSALTVFLIYKVIQKNSMTPSQETLASLDPQTFGLTIPGGQLSLQKRFYIPGMEAPILNFLSSGIKNAAMLAGFFYIKSLINDFIHGPCREKQKDLDKKFKDNNVQLRREISLIGIGLTELRGSAKLDKEELKKLTTQLEQSVAQLEQTFSDHAQQNYENLQTLEQNFQGLEQAKNTDNAKLSNGLVELRTLLRTAQEHLNSHAQAINDATNTQHENDMQTMECISALVKEIEHIEGATNKALSEKVDVAFNTFNHQTSNPVSQEPVIPKEDPALQAIPASHAKGVIHEPTTNKKVKSRGCFSCCDDTGDKKRPNSTTETRPASPRVRPTAAQIPQTPSAIATATPKERDDYTPRNSDATELSSGAHEDPQKK